MKKKQAWRLIILGIVIILAILYILPTFVPEGTLPKWYPFKKRLNFGLDLKGGLELRYAVDYKKAILENTRDFMFRLEHYLARQIFNKEPGERVTDEELKELRKRVKMTIIAFDTLKVETADEEILEHLNLAEVRDNVDSRYEKIEESGAILFKMKNKEIAKIRDEVVDQTLSIIRKRIDAFGLVEPDVRKTGENNIDVQLPGVTKEQMNLVREKIGQTARLTFRIVDYDSNFFAKLKEEVDKFKKEHKDKSDIYWVDEGGRTHIRAKHKSTLVAFFQEMRRKKLIPDDHVIGYHYVEKKRGGQVVESYYEAMYLFAEAKVTGDHVAAAHVYFKETGEPYVNLRLNSEGAKLFEELTAEHVKEYLAIMLDDDVQSAPQIKEKIPGGNAAITLGGGRSPQEMLKEAQALVTVLTHGAYKAPVHKIQDHEVGPSLGKDAINASIIALTIGTLLVIGFMVFYYRLAGLIADICLVLNMIFILAILIGFNAALTLPGVAGLILTVGMAVDANVIIYERIREELRAGKKPAVAIDTGYSKATWTIIDAQITTALAALILMNFTTGPVYGFAVTLLIGIITSVFTALYISKLIFLWLLDHGFFATKLSI